MDSGRLEIMSSGAMHLDTVRSLHQTVVSLRTALEVSKNELKDLKERYQKHSNCLEYADVIEKLTIENHILRRKIIDSGFQDSDLTANNIKLEVTYSPHSQNIDEFTEREVVIKTATTDGNSALDTSRELDYNQVEYNNNNTELQPDIYQETDKADESSVVSEDKDDYSVNNSNVEEEPSESHAINVTAEFTPQESGTDEGDVDDPESQVASYQKEHTNEFQYPNFKTKLELLSKFDVRIKVRTLKEGSIISSTTSDTDSTVEENKDKGTEKAKAKDTEFHFKETREHFENSEDCDKIVNLKTVSSKNIKMAVPNEAEAKSKTDKFDVQVRITSEENLVVKENVERNRKRDTLNLDVDDLSLRSLSEGDNSVFSESGVTPVDPAATEDKLEQDNASGNESEEVDDIELIFTTDESKDISNLQEDLVSIREGEPWMPSSASTHSTPVLIKFNTLDPDFQPEAEHRKPPQLLESLKLKRVSLPSDKEIRHVAFNGRNTSTSLDLPGRSILKSCDNKSDMTLYKRSPNTSTRRLDSVDSLTCEYNRGMSFDNTKSSSFELGSSMDILHREESVDSFHKGSRLGHRFSVFAETDISKCGISEDDLVGNLNIRRNTCPNPFQYRPFSGRGRVYGRAPMPCRARPVLRTAAAHTRESGAQTELCALPAWSSDGHLAHRNAPLSSFPRTQRTNVRLTVPEPRQTVQRRDRDLLSDIGFTSMVPELSRSADPLWAGRRPPLGSDSGPDTTLTTNTSKYISRSSFRSPLLSVDKGSEWIPQNVFIPTRKVDYRMAWRSSLPDVRRDDTEELLQEAEMFLRRSTDNIPQHSDTDSYIGTGTPYIPAEPRQLRLGHTVKLITPSGRIAVGRVRYVGIAGGTAANSSVVVGAEFLHQQYPGLPRNDGTHLGRRYFLAQNNHTALFVPFSKVVMAWAI